MIDLKEQVAVVTGGSRGIGRSIVILLAKAGAKVVFSYASDLPAANAVVAEVQKTGGSAFMVPADVSRREEAESLVEEAQARFDRGQPVQRIHRTMKFKLGVDAGKVEATFRNGVLHVTLPKSEEAKPKEIQVSVN